MDTLDEFAAKKYAGEKFTTTHAENYNIERIM